MVSEAVKCEDFPDFISFHSNYPDYEFVKKGVCQLIFNDFKQLYDMIKKPMNLPELSKKPEIINYQDKSFALNWWPHQIYRLDRQETFDHEFFSQDSKHQENHQNYVDNLLNQKKILKLKLEEFSARLDQPSQPVEALKEEMRLLREENEIEKSKVIRIEAELSVTSKRLED